MHCSAGEFAGLSRAYPVIDVRSPREFAKGHLPGAHSMPLFSDEERHIVGLLYAREGRDAAVKEGLRLVGPKLAAFVDQAESIAPERRLLVYCWRGGMRSGSIGWLLRTAGFSVTTLTGGYKAWRRYAGELFARPWPFIVIGGATGSGKSAVLRALREAGESILDLEHEACHRGSAFGAIGLAAQPTQEHFENRCAMGLHLASGSARIWMEDESRSIGRVNLPAPLWQSLLAAPVAHLIIPREQRVRILEGEYGIQPREALHEALSRISRRLSPERSREAFAALADGRTDIVADRCLDYYDKYYARALQQRPPERVTSFSYATLDVSRISNDLMTSFAQNSHH